MMTESKMYDDLVETFQGVKWTNIIDNLTPTSTLTIDPKIPEFSETFLESGCEKFMGMVKRAVFAIMKQKYSDTIDFSKVNVIVKGLLNQ